MYHRIYGCVIAVIPHDKATPFLEEGEQRLAAEDWDGAIAAFQLAVQAAPQSAVAHSRLGVAYAHKQLWNEALGEFSKAIQIDPLYAPAHSNLGNVHREQGQLEEAIACYKRAIAVDPEYWIAHQNLGVVYKQQGRIAEAVREFKIATRLSLRTPARPGTLAGTGGSSARAGCLSPGIAAALLVTLLTGLSGRI